MNIKNNYSPNFSRKIRKNQEIKLIIIHYTGMQSKIASIKRLLNPNREVSCHYLVDRKGKILKMVEENKIAWHAGKSKWKKFVNLNKNSIGIELVNKGHKIRYEKFTDKQINQLIKLVKYLKKKYKIQNSNIVGHSDIAPLRKKDPGEKFPWKKLKNKNLGKWYKVKKLKIKKLNSNKTKKLFFENLFKIGYRYFDKNKSSSNDLLVIKAFQRHYLQKRVTGKIDQKTLEISHFLAAKDKK
tara:strand:- start:100 stop:822 length:723 start_codon:yes stop_codon:yes gene_type:complete